MSVSGKFARVETAEMALSFCFFCCHQEIIRFGSVMVLDGGKSRNEGVEFDSRERTLNLATYVMK